MKKMFLAAAVASLAIPAAPAMADHTRRHYEEQRAQRYYTTDNGIRYWQGNDGRYYCKKSNGTTGLIIGAAGGALLGRAIDTRGSRVTGTVLGAAAGALLGRQVQRGASNARCR